MSPERTQRYTLGFSSLLQEESGICLMPTAPVPQGLTGTMYRIGPSRFEINHQTVSHWLDGFAAVSSVEFYDGGVTFHHRFVASSWYRRALVNDSLPPDGFASGKRQPNHYLANDNANMNIVLWRGQMELLGCTRQSVLIDPFTLITERTQRRTGITSGMARNCICSPHPVVDQKTGERYDLVLSSREPTGYTVMVTDLAGKTRHVSHVPSSRLSYMHSFSVTKHWIVLVETPFTAHPRSIVALRRPYLRNFVWDAARGTRVFVIDRVTGTLKATLATRPLFVLHHINAWDDGEDVVVDVAAYADPSILGKLSFTRGEPPAGGFPCPLATRLTIDLSHKLISCVPLKCPPGEFATVDPRYVMQPHTRLFAAGSARAGEPIDRLSSFDLLTGSSAYWSSDDCMPGAPSFVPASNQSPQGTGWLLSVVLDVQQKRSFVLILDATKMTEVTRAWLPHALPFGLHTIFVPREVTR